MNPRVVLHRDPGGLKVTVDGESRVIDHAFAVTAMVEAISALPDDPNLAVASKALTAWLDARDENRFFKLDVTRFAK